MPILSDEVVINDSFGNTLVLKESGQIGRYQDSRWSGTVTIERDALNHEDTVKELVERAVKHGHIYGIGNIHPFASPYFTELKQGLGPTASKTWAFVVMRDYLD